MDASPIVSVILPVFNGGALLDDAVRSVLTQTLADFELLLIDDGSTDGAVARAQSLGDPRLRVIGDAARRGLAARLNEGIAAARGRYIARMDADDLSFATRLEKQARFLDAHSDIDLVGCRAVVFREDGEIIGLHPFAATHQAICAHPWRGFPLPHPTWMGRAAWFRKFLYATPEVKRAEDQELLLRSYEQSRFACLDEVLLGYRQGEFFLRKTLQARWHLGLAQQRVFIGRGAWRLALLAAAAMAAKIAVDLLAALPGCDKLFFARMSESVPPQVIAALQQARVAT